MQVEMLAEVSTTLNSNVAHRRIQSMFSVCGSKREFAFITLSTQLALVLCKALVYRW